MDPSPMDLRRADHRDSLDLLAWRNDAQTRATSRTTETIAVDAHRRWFARAVSDGDRLLLIGEDEQGKLGMVRFDRVGAPADNAWVASVNVAPARRGHGHGFALLRGGLDRLIAQAAPITVSAEVKADNQASRRLFEGCGFLTRGRAGDFDQMVLTLGCGHHAVFCARASAGLGAGHVMRCLTLADALARRGVRCRFVTTPETGPTVAALGGSGHGVTVIPDLAFTDPAALAAAVAESGAENGARTGAELVVVDSYQLDAAAETALAAGGHRLVLAIDDLADRRHSAALLLDQTLGRSAAAYAGLVPPACRLRLGPDYALLRPQFARARPAAVRRRHTPGPVRRLVVAMGGTDPADATGLVLAALAGSGLPLGPTLSVDVVLGRAAPALAAVQARAASMAGVTVHVDVADLAPLLGAADLAVGAAGTASWERCCLGLPTLAVVLADNQNTVSHALAAAGAIVAAGPVASQSPATLAAALAALAADPAARQRMAASALALCDGLGAERVAELLVSRLSTAKRARMAP